MTIVIKSYWLKIWRSSGARRKVKVNPTFRQALDDRSSFIFFQCFDDRLRNRLVEMKGLPSK